MTDTYEPRQVRKEAAVSKAACVVALSTSYPGGVGLSGFGFERGCTAKASLPHLSR